MSVIVRGGRDGYLYSGLGREGTATAPAHPRETAFIDARGSEKFMRYFSGSSNGPSGSASAVYTILHSHDKTAYTVIETVTSSGIGIGVGTAVFSAGPYYWLAARLDKVYSAAQSGTGHLFLWVNPSPR